MAYPPAWKLDLDEPKLVPDDPPDDEFDQGAGGLDPQWTVVDGINGVVDLFAIDGGIYDLTSREGWLLIQVDSGNHVRLRQDYTLPDGKSIILAISITLMADGQSGIGNDDLDVGLTLNDDDDVGAGNLVTVHLDSQIDGWRIYCGTKVAMSTPQSGVLDVVSCPIAKQLYFRIARDGLDYYGSWSVDSETWFPFAKQTYLAALDNIWIVVSSTAGMGDPTPIQAVHWIRQGNNSVDPW